MAVTAPSVRAALGWRARSAATARALEPLNATRHHAPMFIGERGLKILIMFRKRAGRPRSATSSGGAVVTTPRATLRAIAADRWSPAASQASATNAEPDAMPPTQK